MKHWTKILLSLLAIALLGTACKENEEPVDEPLQKPTVTLGEPLLNTTKDQVGVVVTPSENTEKWHWQFNRGEEKVHAGVVEGSEKKQMLFDVEADAQYLLEVWAENAAGQSDKATAAWYYTAEHLGITPPAPAELAEVAVKNVSSFSMDVEVVIDPSCARYVVMGMPTSVLVAGKENESVPYTEEEIDALITENARLSLDPESNGGIQPYHVATESTLFTERTLIKGMSEGGLHINPETEYLVAVYALGADDAVKIYKQKVTTPAPKVEGTVDTKLEVTDLGSDHFTLQASADATCSRLIFGYFHEDEALGQNGRKFDDVAESERAQMLVSLAQLMPQEYSGVPCTYPVNSRIYPENDYVGYAIAIDKEGKLGKVVWAEFTTKPIELNGTGKISAVTFGEQEPTDQRNGEQIVCLIPMNITIQNATALRLYYGPKSDFQQYIEENLERGMVDETLGIYTEYKAVDLAKPINLYIDLPGQEYAVFGATVDAAGKVSPVQNLVEVATNDEQEFLQTTEVVVEVDTNLLSGTGEVTLAIKDVVRATPEDYAEFSYEITKGKGTVNAWWLPVVVSKSSEYDSNEEIKAEVLAAFEEFPAKEPHANNKVKFDDSGVATKHFEYIMENYPDPGYTLYILVTSDENNKLKITHTYCSGNDAPTAFVE